MPRLSDTMEDGVVASWLKQVGDPVARGEVLAEIETDKALMELEAYDDGVLERIIADAGARVPIGEPIAIVGDGSGASGAAAGAGGSGSAAHAGSDGGQASSSPAEQIPGTGQRETAGSEAETRRNIEGEGSSGASGGDHSGRVGGQANSAAGTESGSGRRKSSPLARKIAKELGVDLAAVTGTGPGGRITRRDVESAAATPAGTAAGSPGSARDTAGSGPGAPASAGAAPGADSAPGEGASGADTATAGSALDTPAAESAYRAPGSAASSNGTIAASGDYDEVPLTTIQRVSAGRLTESKQQAPHIYLTSAIDVTDLLAFRAEINATLEAAGQGKVSVNDLLVKAVASTLRADPAVNVSFAGDKLLRHHGIHLGVAVATPAGLLVPVIRDADRKSVSEIAAEARDLAGRARDRKLRAEEMSGGTFTLSNLGMFGIEQFTAVINPPESGILAVGAAQDELRLDDSKVVTRKILRVTLSADHRAVDGAVAARFLQRLKELLEHPLRIIT